MRRVVVTGIGLLTPLGSGVKSTWENLLAGKSGIGLIDRFDTAGFPAKIAGQIPFGDDEGEFNVDALIPRKDQKKMGSFIHYAIAAATEAVEDSGWIPDGEDDKGRTGVLIGSGIGGLQEIEKTSIALHEKGARKVSPFFIPASLINLASGHVSIKYGFTGPNHSVVTACATGVHAIGDAARIIKDDDADVMIAGGAEAAICKVGMAGFASARALSTGYNDRPTEASRPWDSGRDGFVMGEGSGIVVLEEYEHAKKRGAKIYGEIVGYGLSGDAYHLTAPEPNGRGACKAMRMALDKSGLDYNSVDYINAHGTSTPLGDEIEVGAVKKVFGEHAKNLYMSSTKSSIGHLLGAAGSVEAIFCLLAMRDSVIPATLNLENPSEGCDLDFVPLTPKEKSIDVALSNSFGFGGTNASVVMKKI